MPIAAIAATTIHSVRMIFSLAEPLEIKDASVQLPYSPGDRSSIGRRSPRSGSIDLQPARFDRAFPARHFVGDEFGKVFRRSAVGRDTGYTDLQHPAFDHRVFHRRMGDVVELVDDRLRRTLRQED